MKNPVPLVVDDVHAPTPTDTEILPFTYCDVRAKIFRKYII